MHEDIHRQDQWRRGHKARTRGALRYLRAGDTLCIWRLDRLSRSLHDLLALAECLDEAAIGLHSITELIDTSTPNGRLFFSIAGAFAQSSAMLSSRGP